MEHALARATVHATETGHVDHSRVPVTDASRNTTAQIAQVSAPSRVCTAHAVTALTALGGVSATPGIGERHAQRCASALPVSLVVGTEPAIKTLVFVIASIRQLKVSTPGSPARVASHCITAISATSHVQWVGRPCAPQGGAVSTETAPLVPHVARTIKPASQKFVVTPVRSLGPLRVGLLVQEDFGAHLRATSSVLEAS